MLSRYSMPKQIVMSELAAVSRKCAHLEPSRMLNGFRNNLGKGVNRSKPREGHSFEVKSNDAKTSSNPSTRPRERRILCTMLYLREASALFAGSYNPSQGRPVHDLFQYTDSGKQKRPRTTAALVSQEFFLSPRSPPL